MGVPEESRNRRSIDVESRAVDRPSRQREELHSSRGVIAHDHSNILEVALESASTSFVTVIPNKLLIDMGQRDGVSLVVIRSIED